MVFLSIILKVLAWVLFDRFKLAGLCAWGLSIVLDGYAFWPRGKNDLKDWLRIWLINILRLNLGCLVLCVLLWHVDRIIQIRCRDGWGGVAAALALLLQAIHVPVSSLGGKLYLTTMSGSLEFPVTYDGLWLSLALMAVGLSVPYLLTLKGTMKAVIRGLMILALSLIGAVLVSKVMEVGLILFLCNFVSYESEELPVLPFFDPATGFMLFLPFLLALIPVFKRVRVFAPDLPLSGISHEQV